MRHHAIITGAILAVTAGTGCHLDDLTLAEAQEAIDEAVAASEGEALTAEIIEVSTGFTLGSAVEAAADELRAFAASQIPCSTVSLEGATVTIDFGTLADACTYRGHTYAGVVQIAVQRNADNDVEVHHVWDGLTNGDITLDGDATVTWKLAEGARHVVHHATWTGDEGKIDASGDRTQVLIDPALGLAGGIRVDGQRSWVTASGTWQLAIDGVEMRGQDPVPQAGSYALTTPKDKTLEATFERIDASTIQVTVSGGRRDFVIKVHSAEE